jgi:DNA-binding CsgD family transcriptional regulator
MTNRNSNFELLELIYEAAGDRGLWPSFLERFSGKAHGTGALLLFCDVQAHQVNVSTTVGIEEHYVREYNEHYNRVDHWLIKSKSLQTSGNIYTSDRISSRRDLARTEYYNDFLRPQGHTSLLCGVILATPTSTSFVATYRKSNDPGAFSDGAKLLNRLMPHLQRGFELHRRLAQLKSRKCAITQALECYGTGVVLLDGFGRILFINAAAEQLIGENRGINLVNGGVKAILEKEDEILQRTVRGAVTKVGPLNSHIVRLTQPESRRRCFVSVTPIVSGNHLFQYPTAATALFITPDRVETSAEVLCKTYELTAAESRLAGRLLSGESLSAAAEQLSVTKNTVRTQLKSIFLKTDTRRQSELLRLLAHSRVPTHDPIRFGL